MIVIPPTTPHTTKKKKKKKKPFGFEVALCYLGFGKRHGNYWKQLENKQEMKHSRFMR
jgi:hypothetical protein